MTTFKFGNGDHLIENITTDANDTVILGNGDGNEVHDGTGVGVAFGGNTIIMAALHKSVVGTKRTWRDVRVEAAFGGEADIGRWRLN